MNTFQAHLSQKFFQSSVCGFYLPLPWASSELDYNFKFSFGIAFVLRGYWFSNASQCTYNLKDVVLDTVFDMVATLAQT